MCSHARTSNAQLRAAGLVRFTRSLRFLKTYLFTLRRGVRAPPSFSFLIGFGTRTNVMAAGRTQTATRRTRQPHRETYSRCESGARWRSVNTTGACMRACVRLCVWWYTSVSSRRRSFGLPLRREAWHTSASLSQSVVSVVQSNTCSLNRPTDRTSCDRPWKVNESATLISSDKSLSNDCAYTLR